MLNMIHISTRMFTLHKVQGIFAFYLASSALLVIVVTSEYINFAPPLLGCLSIGWSIIKKVTGDIEKRTCVVRKEKKWEGSFLVSTIVISWEWLSNGINSRLLFVGKNCCWFGDLFSCFHSTLLLWTCRRCWYLGSHVAYKRVELCIMRSSWGMTYCVRA